MLQSKYGVNNRNKYRFNTIIRSQKFTISHIDIHTDCNNNNNIGLDDVHIWCFGGSECD